MIRQYNNKTLNKALSAILAVLLIAMPVMAQQVEKNEITDYMQGKMDGQRDGKSSSEILWLAVGCLLGPVAILIGYLVPPYVPGDRLIGKSPEYTQGYTEGYQNKGKQQNAIWAAGGCLLQQTIGWCIYYFLVIAAASTQYAY